MPAKLKTATAAVIGGALTTIAIPAASAQAASHPGPAAPRLGSAAHPKAATPSAACGSGITWQDNHDNRYLEIYHSGKANGNWADAYPGNGTCTQHWYAVASGSSNFFGPDGGAYPGALYGMVNTNSGKCLAAPDTNIGNAHVVQESCGYSRYNDRWAEVSEQGGWVLVETILNGNRINPTNNFVGACEDIANRWIYTSYWYNATGAVHNTPAPSNCIWH
jgi:hypothetical protein